MNADVHGGPAPSVLIAVHVFAPAGLDSKSTFAVAPTVAAFSVTVPEMFAPGLESVTLGGVAST